VVRLTSLVSFLVTFLTLDMAATLTKPDVILDVLLPISLDTLDTNKMSIDECDA
jgi:hypothetical protein